MSRDLRRYARQTNIRLFAGFFVILFVVGEGLIYLLYGRDAALFGLACLLMGTLPLVLIGLAMLVLDWAVRKAKRD